MLLHSFIPWLLRALLCVSMSQRTGSLRSVAGPYSHHLRCEYSLLGPAINIPGDGNSSLRHRHLHHAVYFFFRATKHTLRRGSLWRAQLRPARSR